MADTCFHLTRLLGCKDLPVLGVVLGVVLVVVLEFGDAALPRREPIALGIELEEAGIVEEEESFVCFTFLPDLVLEMAPACFVIEKWLKRYGLYLTLITLSERE